MLLFLYGIPTWVVSVVYVHPWCHLQGPRPSAWAHKYAAESLTQEVLILCRYMGPIQLVIGVHEPPHTKYVPYVATICKVWCAESLHRRKGSLPSLLCFDALEMVCTLLWKPIEKWGNVHLLREQNVHQLRGVNLRLETCLMRSHNSWPR